MKKGSKVRFGRPNGKKTVGAVIKVNQRSFQVQVTEAGGAYAVGQKIRVDKQLCADLGETVEVPKQERKSRPRVTLGTKFFASVADGMAEFEVRKRRGNDTYECVAVDLDFQGTQKVYGGEEIRAALGRAAAHDRMADAHTAFYEGLEVGATVHYHNGFGEYVRCEVVLNPNDGSCPNAQGSKCLKEMALVGKWREYDLRVDGYHAKGVSEGRLFQAHATCIYENEDCSLSKREADPRGMEPCEIKGQTALFA